MFQISGYIKELILKFNSQGNSVREIAAKLTSLTPYQIRKFLKSQPGIFIPPKPNPNPPIDQITTYKILNLYDERVPAINKVKRKKELKSHRPLKTRKYSMRDLAIKFNISQPTVFAIIHANRAVDIMRRKAMNHTTEDKAHLKWKRQRIKKKQQGYVTRKRGPKSLQITPDQFWQSVNKMTTDLCWLWEGETDELGYGRLRWGEEENKKYTTVRRIAATLCDPPLIPNIYAHERIKSTCHNPKICCNPTHMTVTTPVKPRVRIRIKLDEARFILSRVNESGLTPEIKKELIEQLNIGEALFDRIISNPELVRQNIIEKL